MRRPTQHACPGGSFDIMRTNHARDREKEGGVSTGETGREILKERGEEGSGIGEGEREIIVERGRGNRDRREGSGTGERDQ